MRPKNVAFLLFSDGIGGAEKVVQKISQAASEVGTNVFVIVNEEIFPFFKEFCTNATVITIGSLYYFRYQKKIQNVIDFARILMFFKSKTIDEILIRINVELVFSNLMYDLNYLAHTKLKIKKIAVVHGAIGVDPKLQKYVFSAQKTQSLLDKVDFIISVSEPISQTIRENKALRQKVTTVNNGTSVKKEFYLARKANSVGRSSKVVFLFCGGDKPVKGGRLLKDAINFLFEKRISFDINIAGKIENNSFWYELRDRYPQNVKILGFLSEMDLVSEMVTCDCILMPSISEGDPLVVNDAIALNKPVLSSNIEAFKNVIADDYRFELDEIDIVCKLREFVDNVVFRENYKYLKGIKSWREVWFDYLKVFSN